MNPTANSPDAAPDAPGRVLVVDDTPANVRLLAGILKVEGFHVDSAPGGAAALEMLEALEPRPHLAPDVVLLDVMMPEMDGFEVCRRIRARAASARLPVVMVTALQETDDRVRALEAGADDFLSKPVDGLEVVARVRSLVRAKRDRDALESAHLALQQAEQARENMTAMLVHDLRTPLTTMLASLDLLLPPGSPAEPDEEPPQAARTAASTAAAPSRGPDGMQGELLALCARSGRHLLSLVNQMLDVARLEDGEMPLRIEDVPVSAVFEEAVSYVSARSPGSHTVGGSAIEARVEPGAEVVRADRDLLGRVLTNLLGNAVKFTRRGTPVCVHAQARGGERGAEVVFSVRDQGPGIEESERERIFDKFAQARSRSHRRSSSGLGLFFCRLAVEAHGGRLWVESAPDEGSTFLFTLPHPPPEPPARASSEARAHSQPHAEDA